MLTSAIMLSDKWWFSLFELSGIFVFACSGAIAGVRKGLDPFGVLVLSFITACGGGLTRDVLLGAFPPAVISDWRYLPVTIVAGLSTFYGFRYIDRFNHPFLWFDAIGLGFFSMVGSLKALDFNMMPHWAIVFGVITGIGGGIMRDIMLAQVPLVLRADFYALPALLGSTIMIVLITFLGVAPGLAAFLGASVCLALRMLALRYHWRIPGRQIEDEAGK